MSQSSATMSIDKMIHSHEKYETTQKTGKVKVFYSFKGSDATCLSSFGMFIPSTQYHERWIPISLKQCLLSVCSSCPDQLMQSDFDAAIYSANVEESNIGQQESLKDVRATVIWEGHGLLSNLLRDEPNNDITVTGQLAKANGESFDYAVQILLQLHPIRQSPPPPESSPGEHQQQQRTRSLPSMKSLFASSYAEYPSYPSSSLSPPVHQPSHEQHQQHQQHPQMLTSHTTRMAGFRPVSTNQPPLHCELDFILPLSSSTSYHSSPQHQHTQGHINSPPHPYDERSHKKFTPPSSITYTSSHHHQHNSSSLSLSSSHLPPEPARSSSSLSATPTPTPTPTPVSPSSSSSSSSSPPTAPKASLVTGGASSTKIRKTTPPFYHQSRKKKRDTKPPNASDIRPFVEVDRDLNGQYILPVEVDSWTVLDLGFVVWDRVAFHNQRYIYPVGYRVKKWYRSMVDPHSDTQYTCQILDDGDEPIFQLEADDNPGQVWRGPTPTTVWTIAVRRAFAIRNMDYGHNPVGPDFFGLRKNTIAKMIQDLPNANKCKNYIWQNFEATTNTTGAKNKATRRSNTRVSTSSSSIASSSSSTTTTTTTGESAFTAVNYSIPSSTASSSVLPSTHSRFSPPHPMSTSSA